MSAAKLLLALFAAAATCLVWSCCCACANAGVPPGLLEQFTKETGIKVIYSTYESNESMYARLKTWKDEARRTPDVFKTLDT